MPNHDYSAGEVMTAANMDAYSNNSYFAQMRQTVTQTLSDGVFAAITFTTEDADTDGGHDTGSNTSRYTCQTAGWWELTGGVAFVASATNQRLLQWKKNGTAINGSGVRINGAANGNAMAARTIMVNLSVGDYVELFAHQNTGGNLDTLSSADMMSSMTVRRIST